MKVCLILICLFTLNVAVHAQKEVIIGVPSDINYLNLKGLDNTNAILMDNGKLRLRHHYDFLSTDRDFMHILLDADNNQTNSIFSLYKDTFQSGATIPIVRFSLDGFHSWINSGNFGIGDISPTEKLTVNGAIKIGSNNFNSPGVIRYFNNDFQGYTNGVWRSLTQDADASPTNEIQYLTLSGNNLKISNGNDVDLPFQEVRDADGDTYLTAESSPDDDKITIGLGNQSRMNIAKTTGSDRTYLSFPNNGNNILLGANSANIASTGINNTYIGGTTGTFNQSGSENIMIGRGTGLMNEQSENVFIGNGVASSSIYDKNVAIGNLAGNLASLQWTVAIGYEAAINAQTTSGTYIGFRSGQSIDGSSNSFFGSDSGLNWESGSYNTAIGARAGPYFEEGGYNTFLGYAAGGFVVTSGSHNTIIGADASSGGYDNSVALGYHATCTASDQVMIGRSSINSIGGHEPWTNFSDGRYKSNLKSDVPGLNFINLLQPVTYHLEARALDQSLNKNHKQDTSKRSEEQLIKKEQIVYSGFIAQEVEASAQAIGYDFSGVDKPQNENDYYGLRYAMFTVPLVKAVQELSTQNALQGEEIEALKSENASLKNQMNIRLASLENQMNLLEQANAAEKTGDSKTN